MDKASPVIKAFHAAKQYTAVEMGEWDASTNERKAGGGAPWGPPRSCSLHADLVCSPSSCACPGHVRDAQVDAGARRARD